MSHLAVAVSLGVLMSSACAGEDSARKTEAFVHDAGKASADAATNASVGDEDSGARDAIDLHALLIAELIETEGSLVARCPCLTASGMYQSTSECMDAVSLGRQWVACANGLDLSAYDNAEIRANLRCNIEELKQRGQCLMGSSCSDDDIAACMTASLHCDKLPLEVLSQFAVQCQIAFSR